MDSTSRTGLNLAREEQEWSEKDWIHGEERLGVAPVQCIALIPVSMRESYLPTGEIQRSSKGDMMDCATRAPLNILEAKFTYLFKHKLIPREALEFLQANGYVTPQQSIEFSDAFIAILSGTTKDGNSLKAPLEAIRTKGLIPKHLLPLESQMTFEEYHDPSRIKAQHKNLGAEFLKHFTINYERVLSETFDTVLAEDLIDGGVYAWPKPTYGVYKRTGNTPNHAVAMIKKPRYRIFDNYLDSVDKDFIKVLDPDYDVLPYGYRTMVSLTPAVILSETWPGDLVGVFFRWLTSLFKTAKTA